MPVNLIATPAADLFPVPGVRWGITEAGIRKANRKDLAVLLLDEGASVGAVLRKTNFALLRCKSAVNTWPKTRAEISAFARWSSTPAMPTQAQARTA